MKWGHVAKEVWQAQNDIVDACELRPNNRWGEEKAEDTEVDQWGVDEMYKYLESAAKSIEAAKKKLKPHTTKHKSDINFNLKENP